MGDASESLEEPSFRPDIIYDISRFSYLKDGEKRGGQKKGIPIKKGTALRRRKGAGTGGIVVK